MNSIYQEYTHGSHVRWDCTYHIVIAYIRNQEKEDKLSDGNQTDLNF